MALLNGFLVLTPGAAPGRIAVAWRPPEGPVLPPEDRPLQYDGGEVEPSVIIEAFRGANADDELEKIGTALWQCLGGGAAGAAWRHARQAVGAGNTLRTILDLSAAGDDWKALPWETLWDGGSFLTVLAGQPFVRLQTHAANNFAEGWPRRILVVCGEAEGSAISVRDELEAIEDGLWERRREIIFRVKERPTKAELFKELEDFHPHVLHFIGHGTGSALLINTKESWSIDVAFLKTWLDQGTAPAPHLVFLNACRSQGDGALTPAGRRSLTDTFLQHGVRAVVGMSGEVEGQAALLLSRRFYEEWVNGEPLDVAFIKARLETKNTFESAQPRQHLLACLTVSSPPEQWLSWAALPPTIKKSLGAAPLGDLHTSFVDRNLVRSEIFDAWLREERVWRDPPTSAGLIVVEGDEKCGKTDAVRLVLQAMHARGWVARCHDLDDPSLDWLKALRMLTAGNNLCGVLSDKLPEDHFASFLAKAEATPSGTDPNDAEDIKNLCAAWLAGLKALSSTAPVALALDLQKTGPLLQADGSSALPEYLRHFTQHLFVPLSALPDTPVLIILVMRNRAADVCVPLIETELKLAIRRVRVATFAQTESKWALRQYFRVMLRKQKDRFKEADVPEIRELARAQVEGLLKRRMADMGAGELRHFFHRFMEQLEDYRFLIK